MQNGQVSRVVDFTVNLPHQVRIVRKDFHQEVSIWVWFWSIETDSVYKGRVQTGVILFVDISLFQAVGFLSLEPVSVPCLEVIKLSNF